MRPSALPVMSVISKAKGTTLAEKAVLSNKTRIAVVADVIELVRMDFDGCRVLWIGAALKTRNDEHRASDRGFD